MVLWRRKNIQDAMIRHGGRQAGRRAGREGDPCSKGQCQRQIKSGGVRGRHLDWQAGIETERQDRQ
eukprot:765097-Hanusia_phi.AAC.1